MSTPRQGPVMVDDRLLAERYAKRLARRRTVEVDSRVEALSKQGYRARQIASILMIDLSDVRIQLGEVMLCSRL